MVHPKFDSNSTCLNCAAFALAPDEGPGAGTCHRHAPRPFQAYTTRDVDGKEKVDEQSDGPRFPVMSPMVFGNQMFCCDWVPGESRAWVEATEFFRCQEGPEDSKRAADKDQP